MELICALAKSLHRVTPAATNIPLPPPPPFPAFETDPKMQDGFEMWDSTGKPCHASSTRRHWMPQPHPSFPSPLNAPATSNWGSKLTASDLGHVISHVTTLSLGFLCHVSETNLRKPISSAPQVELHAYDIRLAKYSCHPDHPAALVLPLLCSGSGTCGLRMLPLVPSCV